MPEELDPTFLLSPQTETTRLRIATLLAEHTRYNQQLEELLSKPYLSAEEELEEVRLKKHKLHIKDLIQALETGATPRAFAAA